MLTNLTKTQRAVLVCVVECGRGEWLTSRTLFACVPRGRVAGRHLVQNGLLRTRWRLTHRLWKPTPLGMLVYRGIKNERNDQ
jgi:hypothetical protein